MADLRPVPDLNADGRDEAMVLWWGRESRSSATRIAIFQTPLPDGMHAGDEDFGVIDTQRQIAHLSDAHDVDGDGVPEVLTASFAPDLEIRMISLHPGSSQDLDEVPPRWIGAGGAWQVGLGADWDGDGHPDGWVGAMTDEGGTQSGTAWLLFGPPPAEPTPLDEAPRVHGEPHAHLGFNLIRADLNNDGQDDLVLSAPGGYPSDQAGRVYVFLGPLARADLDLAAADYVFEGEQERSLFGAGLATGDFDGDGLQDLAIGAPGMGPSGRVYLYLGKDL